MQPSPVYGGGPGPASGPSAPTPPASPQAYVPPQGVAGTMPLDPQANRPIASTMALPPQPQFAQAATGAQAQQQYAQHQAYAQQQAAYAQQQQAYAQHQAYAQQQAAYAQQQQQQPPAQQQQYAQQPPAQQQQPPSIVIGGAQPQAAPQQPVPSIVIGGAQPQAGPQQAVPAVVIGGGQDPQPGPQQPMPAIVVSGASSSPAQPPQQAEAPRPAAGFRPGPAAGSSGPAAGAAPASPPPNEASAPSHAPAPSHGGEQLEMTSTDVPAGTIIAGRYKVDKLLGRGGMGAVYGVTHVNTGERLALKVLNPVLATNPQAVERFRTEARAPVKIGTDHVVRVTDADVASELGGVPFLVMELLNGRDLGTELKRRGALPAGEVVLYLRQVARALDKAHAIGIIHRDLKPANLYLTQRDDGTPLVKILDFGIAKLKDGISAELTQDGTIFGTPWYMSPEQARGHASKVGPSADLWALGLIAFRLLTGRNYWSAEGMAALIGQICYDPMHAPSTIAPHLGPRFDQWFLKACNRESDQRFASATEMVLRLAESLGVSGQAQMTGQFEASAAGYSLSGTPSGMSLSGVQGMSLTPNSYAPMNVSAQNMNLAAMNASAAGMNASSPGMSTSSPGMPAPPSGAQGPTSAPSSGPTSSPNSAPSFSVPGTNIPLPSSASPEMIASSQPRKKSPGSTLAIASLLMVVVGGGLTAAWLVFGNRIMGTAPAAAGQGSATTAQAPVASASAEPTTTASAEVAPPPTAEASAPPPASASAAPPAPSLGAPWPKPPGTGAVAPGPLPGPKPAPGPLPGSTAKPSSPSPGPAPAPAPKPKPVKVKF